MQTRADRPARNRQRLSDLVVVEISPGVQKKHIALAVVQRSKRASDFSRRPIRQRHLAYGVDERTRERTELALLMAEMLAHKIHRDPKQPRPRIVA